MRIHLIAIGGAVMHNMALALKASGHTVSGSDDEIFEPSRSRLLNAGLLPSAPGWFPEKITDDLDAVILGMHARADNPELLQAQKLPIPIYNFPEYVYEQSRHAIRVAICGSHGKTTITSMIMHVLKSTGKHFDYLVGAQLAGFDTMVQFSGAPIMIIEGDEYFASPLDKRPKFLFFQPQIALISGIAWDHFNVFPTYENYVHQFVQLADSMTETSLLIVQGEDAEIDRMLTGSRFSGKVERYVTAEYTVESSGLRVHYAGIDYPMHIFGRHNIQNMEGARKVCAALGIDAHDFYSAMQHFQGAAKRLEVFHQTEDHIIFRDFAHAPSKVRATTDAVKEQFPNHRLVACLELHTFSSLNKTFIDQYRNTMASADVRIVYFNPHTVAHKKLPELSPDEVKTAFNDTTLTVINDSNTLISLLKSLNVANTHILLMSSGNFDNLDLHILT